MLGWFMSEIHRLFNLSSKKMVELGWSKINFGAKIWFKMAFFVKMFIFYGYVGFSYALCVTKCILLDATTII